MKTLFYGGVKNGKSRLAEEYTLKLSTGTPIYLATTEFIDDEMAIKIAEHKKLRTTKFTTIEEPLNLYDRIKDETTPILIECVSMWLNNMLFHKRSETEIYSEIEKLLSSDKSIVFVLNDVSRSVVSENALVREFVDISGRLSQLIASKCDEVYSVSAGLTQRLK
ncbi:MAG: adenosylcobinamide kinase [Helicobacteraceae bacterium]|nr:adenosylcobinamide kinase [Helicobacteraceae bacterium]